MAILDYEGNKVVEYRYDAWGRDIGRTLTSDIGELNPFRYRGYVYDEETGLYYLRSRYYGAETGRFVCADKTLRSESFSIASWNNVYSYCNDCPIIYTDKDGRFGISAFLTGLLVGAIVGFATSYITEKIKREKSNHKKRIQNAAKNALIGAVSTLGTVLGPVLAVVGGISIDGLSYLHDAASGVKPADNTSFAISMLYSGVSRILGSALFPDSNGIDSITYSLATGLLPDSVDSIGSSKERSKLGDYWCDPWKMPKLMVIRTEDGLEEIEVAEFSIF